MHARVLGKRNDCLVRSYGVRTDVCSTLHKLFLKHGVLFNKYGVLTYCLLTHNN